MPPGYIPSSNRPVRAPRLHTLSQQTGTCPRATHPPPTDRYQQLRGPPSPNRPVRAPRLHTLSQQTGTCPRASPSPTDRYQQLRGPPPSPNRPVRAPRLHTLSQQIDTCPQASPVPPQTGKSSTLSIQPDDPKLPVPVCGGGGGTEYCPGGEGLAWGHVSICWERVFSLGARTGLLGEGGDP